MKACMSCVTNALRSQFLSIGSSCAVSGCPRQRTSGSVDSGLVLAFMGLALLGYMHRQISWAEVKLTYVYVLYTL